MEEVDISIGRRVEREIDMPLVANAQIIKLKIH